MDSAARVVQVGAVSFRLEGDARLVELSRSLVYPLAASAEAPAEPVRLARRGAQVRAQAAFCALEASSDEALLEELDYRLTCEALARDSAHTALHAACVGLPLGPVLLLGPHLSGKTTLAAALGQLGGRLWCDDITLLRGAPLGVRPVSRSIRVRADAARLLGVETGAPRCRVSPDAPAEGWLSPLACVAVAFKPGARAVWQRPPAPAAMWALMQSTFGLRESPAPRLPQLAALLSSAPFFTFEYGDGPLEGARALLEHLERAR